MLHPELSTIRYVSYSPTNKTVYMSDNGNLKNEEGDLITSYVTLNGRASVHKKIKGLLKSGEIKIKECRGCHSYFILDADQEDWFLSRGMHSPLKCAACRRMTS